MKYIIIPIFRIITFPVLIVFILIGCIFWIISDIWNFKNTFFKKEPWDMTECIYENNDDSFNHYFYWSVYDYILNIKRKNKKQ